MVGRDAVMAEITKYEQHCCKLIYQLSINPNQPEGFFGLEEGAVSHSGCPPGLQI